MAILDPSEYTVLWLAPLEIELQAARLMLDEHHGTEFPEAKNCIFHAGRMCGYNVIIAHVLDRSYGVAWAASVIGEASIFKNIQFSLLVGVAAGLPNPARKPPIDIRLGDVLVARVEGNDAAIIPYGFGKETENDGFQLMGSGHSALDSFGLTTRRNEAPQWSVEQLEELFEQVVQGLGPYSLMCFIDALDECSEIEIRDMMSFFEELSNQAISRNIVFQVCFSSRWYPNITISKGLSLDLGLQKGHKQDILNYIDSKLKIGHDKVAKEVRMELEQRSTRSGLFMWVSLVVGILQRHYDHRGEYGLKKRLDDIPEDLHKLFHDILIRYKHDVLTRDMHDKEHDKDELLLCMQCVLFARRPLAPQELYLALCPGASESGFDGMDEADARKLVLSSSRGLAEVTMSKETPKVQFIHESVRDFLLKGNGLYEVWPEVEWRFRGNSHERLKQCCLNYTNMSISILDGSDLLPKAETGEWIDAKLAAKKAKQRLPFLEYAVESVFYHADTAAGDGVSQAEFFQSFSTADWMTLQYLVRGFTGPVRKRRLLYLLAEHNAANLISRHPEKLFCFKVEDEFWGAPVLAALATKSHEAVCAFMKAHLDIQPPTSHLHGLYKAYFFAVALASGYCKAYTKFSSNAEGTLLHYAARYWYDVAVRELLAQGAHDGIDTVDERGRTPLSWAVSGGPAIMPRETKTFGRKDPVPLSCAAKQRQEVTVQLLLEGRADKEAADNHGATPLTWASRMGHEGIVQLLLDRGAEIEATDENGWTPLSVAVLGFQSSSLKTIETLLNMGANVNATDKTGRTPLSLAVTSQHYRSNVPLLLDPRWGANINIADNNGETPLSWAKARVGGEAIVPLLQSKGASLTAAEKTG
ncbi:Pfs, NB-ARC and Ankyrin domain protein [Akanthomyces lecanii RCEF 1005]|uniref:Pfs, NB-ARC and Ankyrin domain protein n=1 Tax=Akanthomyces lecanii RCEF 1005 TaxID=1081108 RepID=A0A162KKT9_CORDF|nr:Pfs, NB-ARC and Ankyrin domain protein [Akanthomyces lecanii RCEF 1005]